MAEGKYCDGVIKNIVKGMLSSGLVEEVLAFTQGLDEDDIMPTFISDEQDAEKIVTTSYNPSSLAKLISDFTDKERKIGVVVRSCDARAIIELAKRKQVNLDNIYMVGIECYGVAKVGAEKEGSLYIFTSEVEIGGEKKALNEEMLRPSCRRCEYPIPTMADISCQSDGDKTFVKVYTEKGKEIASSANISTEETDTDIKGIKERAAQWQQKDFGEIKEMPLQERLNYWFSQFDKCIKCYGCKNSCPICYCEDCYLGADRVLIRPGEFPPEKLFHLTRLIHVADSCLNCGQCEAACPMNIPLSKLYHMLYNELSSAFGYDSGFDVTLTPPLGTITEEDKKMGGVEFG